MHTSAETMRAYELPAKMTPEGNLELPDVVRRLLPTSKAARVIVLIPESDDAEEQGAWQRLTADQFCSGYAAADAVYDRP
jgi:hypothetical protein